MNWRVSPTAMQSEISISGTVLSRAVPLHLKKQKYLIIEV